MGNLVDAGVGDGVWAGGWRPKVIRWIERTRRRLWAFGIGYGHDIYGSVEEEERYWASARRYRRRLGESDARYQENYRRESARSSERLAQERTREEAFDDFERRIPVISGYQPALPPMRSRRGPGVERDDERQEYLLSNTAFCKWRRMVYPPGSQRPITTPRAAKLKKHHSSRDRREIRRISRLLPNEAVFSPQWTWTPVYRVLWQQWLQRKGPDTCVVFEDE
ncbi:hypothetical protein PM082_022162 [Marasmius tenuissimus]|nr:hypothetical protein PM082_022162 [Marasmius tenuissimus]